MSGFLTRRRVLWTAVAGMAVAGLASAGVCARRSVLAALPLDRLDVALGDIHGAARIARAARAETGDLALLRALAADRGLCAALELDCPATRRAAIRAHVRDEFRAGHVVLADRFVVARSERLIAALRHGSA